MHLIYIPFTSFPITFYPFWTWFFLPHIIKEVEKTREKNIKMTKGRNDSYNYSFVLPKSFLCIGAKWFSFGAIWVEKYTWSCVLWLKVSLIQGKQLGVLTLFTWYLLQKLKLTLSTVATPISTFSIFIWKNIIL